MDPEEITKEEEGTLTPTNTEVTGEEENSEDKTATEPKLAKVEYDYEAKESDELSLNLGDIITVLEQNGGWWKGDLHGKVGIFPANHVKLIEVPTQSIGDEEDDGVKKKNLNKYGVKPGGLGSLFSGGVPTLKKRSQPSLESSSSSEEKHVIASPPVLKKTSVPSPQPSIPLPNLPPKKKPPKPKKVEPKAEVLYDYDAEEDGEISLIPGTLVTILVKDDGGWWTGRDEQGNVGIFPSTYVKEIKQTEEKKQSVSEEATVEEVERQVPDMIAQEVLTSEPASVSADSPPSSVHSSSHEVNNDDSPTLPKSPPPPMRRTTNETSSPPTTNRRSTHESSQVTASKRRSTHEPTSPTSPKRNSIEEHVTSRRPPSVVSPDLPPIQSISTNFGSTDTSPVSPKERPTAPPRQLSRPLSIHENKTESQKSPTLAKPPKTFSPAKPPVVSPVKRTSSLSSKSDKTKSENSPTEPVSPKIDRRASYDQHDSSTSLPEPSESENKDDDVIEDEQKEVAEKLEIREEVEKKVDKETEISDEEKEVNTESLDTKEDDDTTGGHEVEPEEKKPQSQLPPLPTGPKLTSLQKDRPAIKNRKTPSARSIKESASQSQTAILLESVSSAKDEVEQKPQPVASPPTPPKPEKPEKPIKPNSFKLPTLGTGGIQLRSVAKKPSIETSTESTETTSSTSSGIDTKPISGGVKGISSRFNQFGGIPNSSDVELRLKKWFNEEINKLKSNFEAKLAEERSKREALEEEVRELIASLQEN